MAATSEKREVRLTIDSDYLEKLQERVGGSKATDVTRAALALFDWATEEVAQGRIVLSTDKNGGEVRRLATPELSRVKAA